MEKILYASSELSLIIGLIFLLFRYLFAERTVREYFVTAKRTVIVATICKILFYNKDLWPDYYVTTIDGVMFFVLCAVTAYVWLSLSYRWFMATDRNAFVFCFLALSALFASDVILSAVHLLVLAVGLLVLGIVNYLFVCFSQNSEGFHKISRRYGMTLLFFGAGFLSALLCAGPENMSYSALAGYLGYADLVSAIIIIGGIMGLLLVMLAVAPFHFWLSDVLSPLILPVATYFSLIPFCVLWGVFIRLNFQVFVAYRDELTQWYTILAVLSVLIGAFGVHAGRQLKKMFAYVGLFNVGLLMLAVSVLDPRAVINSLVMLQIYIPTMLGIYACCYGLTHGRDYLNNLSMLRGMASVRPYFASAMLFFMVSLMEIAPFAGFLGFFPMLSEFHVASSPFLVSILLIGLLVLSLALVRIVRVAFFMPRVVDYDRPDGSLYLWLFGLIALLCGMVIYPNVLTENARLILESMEK